MSEENDRISKLLRLKRYEQPPPEYFQNFLKEFHVRQRQELLRRPAWKIALERLQTRLEGVFGGLFDRLTVPQLSYAGASVAVLLAAGIFTFNLVQHPGQSGLGGPEFAAAAPQPLPQQTFQSIQTPAANFQTASAPVQTVVESPFTLNPHVQVPDVIPAQAFQPASRTHPRYILDSRPVSYEPPFSF